MGNSAPESWSPDDELPVQPDYDVDYKPAPGGSFFDQFDDDPSPEFEFSVSPGWEPSYAERFQQNFFDAAANWSVTPLLGRAIERQADKAEGGKRNIAARQAAEELDFEQMAPSDTALEYLIATGGQLAGSAADPVNYLFAPVRLASAGFQAARPILARAIEQGAGTAVANAAIDVSVQGIRIAEGKQDTYEPLQTGGAALLGGFLGFGGGAIAARGASRDANFFDRFDDDVLELKSGDEAPLDLLPSDEVAAAAKPKTAAPGWRASNRPVELRTFIRRMGGISDETGELTSMGGRNSSGLINNRRGVHPDKAREALIEAGYLPADLPDQPPTSSIQDVYELIDRSLRGEKIYSELDAGRVAELKAKGDLANEQDEIEAAASFLEAHIQDAYPDFEMRPEEIRAAAELYVEGVRDPDEAIERLAIADLEGERYPDYIEAELEDIPFDDIAIREAQETGGGVREGGDGSPSAGGEASGVRAQGEAAQEAGGARRGTRELAEVEFSKRQAIEPGADGKPQSVIPGAERISDAELAQRKSDAPLKPKAPQDLEPGGPLFGDQSKQGALDFRFSSVPGRRNAAGTQRPGDEAPKLETVIERLIEAASDPAVVRKGRITHHKAAGTYNRKSGVVRVRDVTDLETLTHEIAHSWDFGRVPEIHALTTTHKAELKPLAYAGAPKDKLTSEGFAEFVRYYVTNPAFAQAQAPVFFAEFETVMQRVAPDKLAIVAEVRDAYRAWLSAPSGDAVKTDIVSSKPPGFVRGAGEEIKRHGFRNTLGLWASKIYAGGVDRLHFLSRSVDELLKVYAANHGQKLDLKAADDAYKLARLAVDSGQAGMVDLMHGVVPFGHVNPEGASLFDALELALGKTMFAKWDDELVQEFGAYLAGRRALAEFDRFAAGEIPNPPSKFSRGDWALAVQEMEAAHPEWNGAADLVYNFQANMLRKKFEAGFISEAQYRAFSEKIDYVPLQRDLTDFGEEVGVVARGSGKASPSSTGKVTGVAQAFRGSNRAIVNPLESMMKDALTTANLIARNEVFKALDNLAQAAGPGGGSIVERIPSHELKATKVSVAEMLEAAAREQGLDPRDAQALVAIADEALGEGVTGTIFRPGEISERGEPIVYVWRNGERQALRLADGEFGRSLYAALTGLSQEQATMLTNVLSLPAAALRAGITTSPDFLFANYVRDQLSAWILSDDGFVPFYSGARGMADELMGGEASRMYAQAGGVMGGQNVQAIHKARIKRDVQALRKKGFTVQHLTSFEGLLRLTELSETGTRVGLFKAAFERGKKQGLTEYEALIEAAYTSRDYIDFGRHGSKMIEARRLVPFLNASLQGLDKGVRALIMPFVKHRAGAVLSASEKRQLAAAAKGWAKVATLGLAGLGLTALYRDDPEYEEISDYYRATHWMVKIGGGHWAAIPKPFEFAVLSNIFERAYERIAKDDPLAWERLREGLGEIMLPPLDTPAISVPFELAFNYDNFGDRPIVPLDLQGLEPRLQFNAYTSELARQLGDLLNVSPMYIDHAITGYGGSWGRQILNWSNRFRANGPSAQLDDEFITRRFIKDVSRGATSSRQFWGLVARGRGTWEMAARTYSEMRDQGELAGAEKYLAGKPEGEVAYAVLNEFFAAKEKRLHPLRRAQDAIGVLSTYRKDMSLDRLARVDDGEIIAMPGSIKAAVDDVLSRLSMIEARNGLIATGVEGWRQKQIMDTAPVWKELEAASPESYAEIRARYEKARVYDEAKVRERWPEVQARILKDRGEALLSDLTAGVRY